ncbi:MAG: RdgB/HAM1 family non-canonical purine NTP pyrophosphatase [Atribacterota bacterium]
MHRLVLATGNMGKVKEIREKLKKFPLIIESLQDYHQIPEIEENGKTFLDNSVLKASIVARYTNLPALADDSGLEIDYLKGMPGLYSSRWGKNDRERVARVLKELEGVTEEQRKARFVCVMSLVIPENKVYTEQGVCWGKITFSPQGKYGFGYDPIFIPDGYDQTFAQMGKKIKNKISHRAIALDKIIPRIIAYYHL